MNRNSLRGVLARLPLLNVACAAAAGFGAHWLTSSASAIAGAAGIAAFFGPSVAGLSRRSTQRGGGRKTRSGLTAILLGLALGLGAAVSACAPAQVARVDQSATRTLQGLCQVDQLYQPVTVEVVSGAIPLVGSAAGAGAGAVAGASAALSIDQTTIHPLIVQACKSLGGQAVAAPASPAPSTAASAP